MHLPLSNTQLNCTQLATVTNITRLEHNYICAVLNKPVLLRGGVFTSPFSAVLGPPPSLTDTVAGTVAGTVACTVAAGTTAGTVVGGESLHTIILSDCPPLDTLLASLTLLVISSVSEFSLSDEITHRFLAFLFFGRRGRVVIAGGRRIRPSPLGGRGFALRGRGFAILGCRWLGKE